MADYHSPTVVDAELPIADMTALERLILGLVFDSEEIGDDRLYLYSEVGPSSDAGASIGELREAHAASVGIDSVANAVVWSAFTCTRMRPDGFGGSVTRITPDAIQYRSTTRMLEEMRNKVEGDAAPPLGDGRDTQARLEALAVSAGWDSVTLTLQIARWLDRDGRAQALLDHLARMAADETG